MSPLQPKFTILRWLPNVSAYAVVADDVEAADAGTAFRDVVMHPRGVRPGEYLVVTREVRLAVEINLRNLDHDLNPDRAEQ